MKRIKLTDAELAIGMWTYILLFVENWHGDYEYAPSISKLKLDYLLTHVGYDYWLNDCYLCHKYCVDGICACPLDENGKRCGFNSSWWIAQDYAQAGYKNRAIKAIKKILSVIEKELENEGVCSR